MVTTKLSKKKLFTTNKVTTSEEVEKVTKNLDDNKEAVVTTKLSKKKLFITNKVTTSEEVDKGTKTWMVGNRQWSQRH